tara:strand:+ start:4236 stop:4715 length:480 start_codon:yes stop_codon:yes gene_type:complete
MLNKILALLLSFTLIFIPCVAYAGDPNPDDMLNINGKITVISKGSSAPYTGILFDIPAATKLKLDKQFAAKEFQLKLEFQKKLLIAEHTLKLGNLQVKYDSLKNKTTSLLQIKDTEIGKLQELVKKSPNDYTSWWFVGGIIIGCLLSVGVYYAAVKINQ